MAGPGQPSGGIAHFDDAPARSFDLGHIAGRWTELGRAAGSVAVGVRRIEVPAGRWTTPVHDHGRGEEIFYILAGRGLAWRDGAAWEVGAGDCVLFRAHGGGHTFHALDGLDLLAFGPREHDESVAFARLGLSLVAGRFAETVPAVQDGVPLQFLRESAIGPPAIPDEAAPRPPSTVQLEEVEPQIVDRPRIARARRNLGTAIGSRSTGLQHVEVRPWMLSAPLHCHTLEDELFVVLGGDGTLLLDEAETPVRAGHVVSRPAGTGVSHAFRAGPDGLTYLAYGSRHPGDICWYPTSRKLSVRGVGVIARVQRLDYWDGED